MDTIFVEGLVVSGIHGVTAKEQDRAQPFQIDIRVDIESAVGAISDCVEDAIDYRTLKKTAERIVSGESYALVERIAGRIIEEVFVDVRVRHIEVSVRKLEIWQNGVPGVTIRRKRT